MKWLVEESTPNGITYAERRKERREDDLKKWGCEKENQTNIASMLSPLSNV